jgi:hypothetical protein
MLRQARFFLFVFCLAAPLAYNLRQLAQHDIEASGKLADSH